MRVTAEKSCLETKYQSNIFYLKTILNCISSLPAVCKMDILFAVITGIQRTKKNENI